jgi:hypothetical protein
MNIEKIAFKIVKDALKNHNESAKFILKMILSHLTDEERGAVMDEIVNEREHIELKKGDNIWFNPKDNKYDLKDLYENDILKDALLMTKQGYIKGTIINDCNYKDECNPYASEYKVKVNFSTIRTGADIHVDTDTVDKEIRVNRSNIIKLWKSLE